MYWPGSVVGFGPKNWFVITEGMYISKYVLTDIFCIEKWRDQEEAYGLTGDTL